MVDFGAGGVILNSWFISPSNYSYLRTINHSYWSYVHQLSYRTGASHCNVRVNHFSE